MNKTDEKIKEYMERANNILNDIGVYFGFTSEDNYSKKEVKTCKLTDIESVQGYDRIIEVARMIQKEELISSPSLPKEEIHVL